MLELDKIYNMDCLDGMRLMKEQGIKADWCITDPPYGIGIDGQKLSINKNPKHNRKAFEHKGWDNSIPDKSIFDLILTNSINQIVFGANYFNQYLPQGKKGWVIWDKGQRGLTMSDCELIYTSTDKPTRIYTYNRVELLKDGTIHPTQKPLALIEKLINEFTKYGDLILDPFMGSGTTAVACHKLKRHYIGFELDKEYFDLANERLDKAKAQLSIFDLL